MKSLLLLTMLLFASTSILAQDNNGNITSGAGAISDVNALTTGPSTSTSQGGAGGSSSVGNTSTGASTSTVGNTTSTGGTSSVGNTTTGDSTSNATGGTGGSVGNTTTGDSTSNATGGSLTNSGNSTAVTGASTSNAAGGTSSSGGNSQSINISTPANTSQSIQYSGTVTIKNVPSVNGPALTSSNDTCMGSTSGSINIAGLGFGGGSTYVDDNCKRLKNSRELWNMGMKAASLALMCNDKDNREALEVSGQECPQTTNKRLLSLKAICAVFVYRRQVEATGYECPVTVRARRGNLALQKHAVAGLAEFLDPIIAKLHTDPDARRHLGLPPL
jgi:hypothetical protein